MTEWVDIKVVKDEDYMAPPPEPVCPIGFDNHTWGLVVVEGNAYFHPIEPCPVSSYNGAPVCQWFEQHDLYSDERESLVTVKLEFATDCPGPGGHFLTPCDCNRWLNVLPVNQEQP